MTDKEINNLKYKVCCPVCDNAKCVRGTNSCEAEIWARDKKKVRVRNDKRKYLCSGKLQ